MARSWVRACLMLFMLFLFACGDDGAGITTVDFSGNGGGTGDTKPAGGGPTGSGSGGDLGGGGSGGAGGGSGGGGGGGSGGLTITIPDPNNPGNTFPGQLRFTRAIVSIAKIELKISNSGHGSTEDVKREGQFFMNLAGENNNLVTLTQEIVSLGVESGRVLEEFRFRIDDVDGDSDAEGVRSPLPPEMVGYSILLEGQVELNGQSLPFLLLADLNEEIRIPLSPPVLVDTLHTLEIVLDLSQIFNIPPGTDSDPSTTTPVEEIAHIVSTIMTSRGSPVARLDVHSESDDPARALARLIEDRFDDQIDLFNKTADQESEPLVIQSRG